MPFTLCHPAAALPVRRFLPTLPLDAVVGAMAPDFEYILRLAPRGGIGHWWPGIVLFSLPASLLVVAVYRLLVRPAVLSLLAVAPDASADESTESRWNLVVRTVVAAQAGVLTHVAWDAFTHKSGWVVSRVPILLEPAAALGIDRPWYNVLQHGSTLLGALVLVGWTVARARSRGWSTARLAAAERGRLVRVILVLAVACITGAALNGVRAADAGPERVLGFAAVGGMAAGAVGLVALGIRHRLRR